MSKCSKEKVRCPSCDVEQEFTIWQSINVTLDPDLKEQLFHGDLTTLTCEHCGEKTGVGYDFLYHDMDKSLAVWLVREDDEASQEARSQFCDLSQTTRVVGGFYELYEKVKIFDDGLDDFEIELLKIYTCVSQELDANQPFYYDKIHESDSGGKFLVFAVMVDDEFKTLQYPLEHFQSEIVPLAKELRSLLDPSAFAWARVDHNFVLLAMGKQGGE